MSDNATAGHDFSEDTLPGIGQTPTLATLSNRLERLEQGQVTLLRLCAGTNTEVAELRAFLISDIAPRLTKQEAKTVGAHAKDMAKYVTLASGAVGFALQIAAWANPKFIGPLQTLADFLSKLQ